MATKKGVWIHFIRALFLTLTVCSLIFIFFNSTQDEEKSTQQSVQATVQVQEIVGTIAPDSPIATATGEDFDLLHAFVRNAAHFLEYALLGACMFASYLSFTRKKRYAVLVPMTIAFVSVFDEYTQTLAAGRGAQLTDVLIDIFGGAAGCLFTLTVFLIIVFFVSLSRRKKTQAGGLNG